MFVCAECGAPQPSDGRCPTDGTPLAPIGEDVLLGITIGAYRVARLLGIGGMGRVYKGVHPAIGSRVAIKVLSRECSDRRDLVERFFAEAKAVNVIRHESIVNVLDLAMLPDGRPYIIMEYLDGAPLASIIEHAIRMRQPLPLGGLARLAVEVLDALGAAHAKGIVHRDIKPDNIFVTPSGRPKVLDFGIAKLTDVTSSSTRTGSLLGTPHYMSPEQAAGTPVDHRADIYAMGVILFECATGMKPFLADSLFDLLRKHIEMPPPSPRAARPDMSTDVEGVILTALAKAPDQRFASAQAMSTALQHATAQLSPEQWTPITGSGTHRAVPSGGWSPTAPASWAGAARGPRDSAQPPIAPQISNRSTVSSSSGQVQRQAPASSKKGLWIAIGAVLLAGGGITAAVVAGGGGEGAGSSAAGEPPSGDHHAAKVEPDKADALAARDEALETAMRGLEKDLPASTKQQLDKLGKLHSVPQAERIKKLAETQAELAKGTAKGVTDMMATRGAPPVPLAPATRPPPSGKWVDDYAMPQIPSFNPRRVDVTAFIKMAVANAKKADPNAVLFRIDIDSVHADGFADLTLPTVASDHGGIDLRFFSPDRMNQQSSGVPLGVPHNKPACEFRIEASPDGVDIRSVGGFDCNKNKPIPPPKCSVVALWQRAIAKGAPSSNAVANLGYRGQLTGDRVLWYFDIGTPGDKIFSNTFPDGC